MSFPFPFHPWGPFLEGLEKNSPPKTSTPIQPYIIKPRPEVWTMVDLKMALYEMERSLGGTGTSVATQPLGTAAGWWWCVSRVKFGVSMSIVNSDRMREELDFWSFGLFILGGWVVLRLDFFWLGKTIRRHFLAYELSERGWRFLFSLLSWLFSLLLKHCLANDFYETFT